MTSNEVIRILTDKKIEKQFEEMHGMAKNLNDSFQKLYEELNELEKAVQEQERKWDELCKQSEKYLQ